jgi:hypothetical protein
MKTFYKYKSVKNIMDTTHTDYKYFVDIIENNSLYAATYKELRGKDRWEGVYSVDRNDYSRDIIDKIKEEKIHIGICSLSECANNEFLWEHHADKHSGIVIEVEIDTTLYRVQPVEYVQSYKLEKEANTDEEKFQAAIDILTHKKPELAEEKETRVFAQKSDPNEKAYVDVRIKSIIIGKKNKKIYPYIYNLVKRHNPTIEVTQEE